jgi:hypothetical protein
MPVAERGGVQTIELSDVPFFSDDTTLCGPSSLAAALGYAGFPIQPQALAPTVYLPGRQGALQVEMLSAARRVGAVSYVLPSTQAALVSAIEAGYPVVVLLNLGLSFAPSWHYAVVVGIENAQAPEALHFILRSGEQRRQRMPAYTFANTWNRSGNWAMLVSPAQTIPSFLPQTQVIDALVKFERGAPGDLAVTAYETALAAGIQSSVLQMGLANAHEKQGRLEEAMLIWRQLLEQQRDLAAGVNLAFALQKQNKTQQAVALACSVKRAAVEPEISPQVQVLVQEKLLQLLGATGEQCPP